MTANRSGFTLVEVAFSVGLCAFCLTALLGLFAMTLQNHHLAKAESEAMNLLSMVSTDLRLSLSSTRELSAQYGIPLNGASSLSIGDHRLTVTPRKSAIPKLWQATLEVSWADGSVRSFFAAGRP